MESLYLKTILAVLQVGSFSKAAATLCVTQSAVSHRVKFLEDRFACQLIDRSGAELIPTEAGRRLMKKAEQIILLEQELEEELLRLDKKLCFSICATATFGTTILPKVMKRFFLSQAEKVDLKVMLQAPLNIVNGLKCDDFDIGVIEHIGRLDFSGLKTFELPDDEMVFISAHEADQKVRQNPLTWLLQNCLITRIEGCSCRDLLSANLQKYGLNLSDFKSIVVYDDLRLTIDSVIEGGGIAFVSKALVNDYIKRGQLYEYRVNEFQHSRKVTIALKPNKLNDPHIQFFLGTMIEIFDTSQSPP